MTWQDRGSRWLARGSVSTSRIRGSRGANMTEISEQVKTILDALGGTVDQVAAALKARGVTGTRNTVRVLNPIVRYVGKTLCLTCRSMDVMQAGVLRICMPDGKVVETDLPSAVTD